MVVALMTIRRTLHEELRAFGFVVPAHGQSDSVTHVHIYRNPDTKIQEQWAVRDELSMLRPLGVIG